MGRKIPIDTKNGVGKEKGGKLTIAEQLGIPRRVIKRRSFKLSSENNSNIHEFS